MYWGQNIPMDSPTSDQYHYLLVKAIFLEVFQDISKYVLLEKVFFLIQCHFISLSL